MIVIFFKFMIFVRGSHCDYSFWAPYLCHWLCVTKNSQVIIFTLHADAKKRPCIYRRNFISGLV